MVSSYRACAPLWSLFGLPWYRKASWMLQENIIKLLAAHSATAPVLRRSRKETECWNSEIPTPGLNWDAS
eukprot:9487618-Pyramimonas_sp.AAC.1